MFQHEARIEVLEQKEKGNFSQSEASPERKRACWEAREDYLECLHSRKQIARIKQVIDEKERQEALGKKFSFSDELD